MAIRLIASDVDGTLLGTTHRLSERTIATLAAARDAGIAVVPVSGRQPFSITEALAGTFLAEGLCIGSNGAVGVHQATGEVLFEDLLSPAAQRQLFAAMDARLPGCRAASVRDGGDSFFPQEGYVALMNPGDHNRAASVLPEYPLGEVLGGASVKFVIRHPDASADDLLAAAREAGVPGVHPTTSGVPFLEVSAASVTKASGLEQLCRRLGVERHEVVSFGDNNNDAEMLAWAGIGVAMGNAVPEALAAADQVTDHVDADGVAAWIERHLLGR